MRGMKPKSNPNSEIQSPRLNSPQSRDAAHLRLHDPHSRDDRLRDITEVLRERHAVMDAIFATAENPTEARRIYLAARAVEMLWMKSRRACRMAASDYGIDIAIDGTVRCIDGE